MIDAHCGNPQILCKPVLGDFQFIQQLLQIDPGVYGSDLLILHARSLSDLPRSGNEETNGNGCRPNDALKSEIEGTFCLHFSSDFDMIAQ